MLSAQQHQPLQAAGSHLLPVSALLPREWVRDAQEVSLKRQGERDRKGTPQFPSQGSEFKVFLQVGC